MSDKDQIWQELEDAHEKTAGRKIMELFDNNPHRFDEFSARLGDMVLDYSKTNLDSRSMTLLRTTWMS